jgi:hypothetical protein
MRSTRPHTTVAGVLAIVGMLAGVLSIVPVLETPDYLTLLPAHERQVILGAGFQLLMVPTTIGFALALHPILKTNSGTLTLGFVGFRLIAGTCHLLAVTLLPLFIVLAQASAHADTADASSLQLMAELLRSGRDLINHVALILAVSTSDLLLFRILQSRRLAPTWLTTWGFLAAGLAMLASLLLLTGHLHVVTPAYLAMNGPLALHTLAFAAWLIARGLDSSSPRPSAVSDHLHSLGTSLR